MARPTPQSTRVPLLPRGHVLANRFVIDGVIGQGGMGVVYKAADRRLGGRWIAIKTVHELTPSALRRFEAEAVAAAQISSPYVVTVHDFFEENGVPYMAMELLEGQDLKSVLERGPLAAAVGVDIILAAAHAVFEAHLCGITHRDLTPENIFVLEQKSRENVRVLDFGLSMSSHASRVTGANQLVCTPMYVAPERIAGKEGDPRSDQYSLAVVLYEVLTGRPPFIVEGEGVQTILLAVAAGGAPRADEVRPGFDTGLADLIAVAMAGQPEMRFRSVHAFGRALLPFASANGRATHREYFDGEEPAPRILLTLTGGTTVAERVAQLNEIRSQAFHDAVTVEHDYGGGLVRAKARRAQRESGTASSSESLAPSAPVADERYGSGPRSSAGPYREDGSWFTSSEAHPTEISEGLRPAGVRRRRSLLLGGGVALVLLGAAGVLAYYKGPVQVEEKLPSRKLDLPELSHVVPGGNQNQRGGADAGASSGLHPASPSRPAPPEADSLPPIRPLERGGNWGTRLESEPRPDRRRSAQRLHEVPRVTVPTVPNEAPGVEYQENGLVIPR
jgi:serine/threonine protein kinase